jgi:hypothetical protein
MKSLSTRIVGLFIVTAFALTSCTSGRYYSNFESNKKSVEKLVVIQPYIFVKSVIDQVQTEDIALENQLSKIISAKTNSILSGKYALIPVSTITDTIREKDIQDFFLKLDSLEKNTMPMSIPPFLQKKMRNIKERYCLMFFFSGYYNGYYQPEEAFKDRLLSNKIYLKSRHLFGSDMRLIVFDVLKNKIVYYDNKVSKENDPRRPMIIEQTTSSMLRSIYYK